MPTTGNQVLKFRAEPVLAERVETMAAEAGVTVSEWLRAVVAGAASGETAVPAIEPPHRREPPISEVRKNRLICPHENTRVLSYGVWCDDCRSRVR